MTAAAGVFEAIEAGDADRLRALVAASPKLAGARDVAGVSALMQALYRGRRDLAEVLHAAAPALDVFEAAALGEADRLRELLTLEPALAKTWSADGFSPLHFAAFFGQPTAAELLLERGAEVGAVARNPMLVQPLHSAAATGAAGRHAVSAMLLRAGADPNAVQHGGWTPLKAAAQRGDAELVALLLTHGADPNRRSDTGQSARDLAAEGGHTEVLALLDAL